MAEMHKSIAVLIDADNMPAKCMSQVDSWMKEYGQIKLWRAYGNNSTFQSDDCEWVKAAVKWGIDVRTLLPVVDGKKNTADIAMMLDAMELVLKGECDALCLVSRDSDFRQLAMKLKNRLPVYGLVNGETPMSYLVALTEYRQLLPTVVVPVQPPIPATPALTTAPAAAPAAASTAVPAAAPAAPATAPALPQKAISQHPLAQYLLRIFKETCGTKDSCSPVEFGTKLSALRAYLPTELRETKKGLLKKAIAQVKKETGSDLFVMSGSGASMLVRRKK